MPHYLILAQSEITANALGALVEQLGENSPSPGSPQRIIWKKCTVGQEERMNGVLDYEQLVRHIEEAARDAFNVIPLNEVTILVDSVSPSELNPLQHGITWGSLLAMLILTFPEIYWIFGVILQDDSDFPASSHSFTSLITTPRRDKLLDATGLRNFVRNKTLAEKGSSQSFLPTRCMKAAAIDEESTYALFHAYTAYRFGYLADAVRSWSLMKYLFGCGKKIRREDKDCPNPNRFPLCRSHDVDLLLEDVNLNFADENEGQHFSDLEEKRSDECTLLSYPHRENSRFRILVSSGSSGASDLTMKKNRDYLQRNKPAGCAFVSKPVGGMFNLWIKSRLFERLDPRKGKNWAGNHAGQAPGFIWPPTEEKKGDHHSAPGKVMIIAQNLVRRADNMKEGANSVEECIRGAVLATDALEILRLQTPTLALQALCLKHEFEVRAEVAFLGVGHHFEVEMRLNEMERDVKAASRYFGEARREAAMLDTLVSIGNRLVLVFRNAGQFDEEAHCMARVRKWHRELRLKQANNPLDFVSQWIMAYAEWLLVSPRRFLFAILFWFFVFWGLWLGIAPEGMDDGKYDAASFAWNSFIAANPASAKDFMGNILNAVASAFGLFHLGVFISYIYSAVSRK